MVLPRENLSKKRRILEGAARSAALKTAVVSIKCKEGGTSYAEVLAKARRDITIEEIGITETKIRRGVSGARIIEIGGSNCRSKAKALADRIKKIVPQEVIIRNPTAMGEIKLYGFDDTVDILKVLSREGELNGREIELGRIGVTKEGVNPLNPKPNLD